MKRFLFLVIAVAFMIQMPVAAQETGEVRDSAAFRHAEASRDSVSGRQERDTTQRQRVRPWHFSAGAGAQVFLGRNDSKMAFGDRIVPSLDLMIGRRITNVLALDLTFSTSGFRGVASPLVKDAHFIVDRRYAGANPDEALVLQDGCMMDLCLRLMVDLTAWWGRNNPDRKSSASIYVGGGLSQGYGNNSDAISPSINGGFVYGYHFSEALALDLTLNGALVSRDFDGEHCTEHVFHGLVGANIGITYSFGR